MYAESFTTNKYTYKIRTSNITPKNTVVHVCYSLYRLIHRTQQSPAGAVSFVWVLKVDLLPDGMRQKDEVEWGDFAVFLCMWCCKPHASGRQLEPGHSTAVGVDVCCN